MKSNENMLLRKYNGAEEYHATHTYLHKTDAQSV